MNTKPRPVPGYRDLYARPDGTVLRRTDWGFRVRMVRHHKSWRYVRIKKKHRVCEVSLAQLVLSAFVGKCPPGHRAVHLDGNPKNNKLSNLAWKPYRKRGRSEKKPKYGSRKRKSAAGP